jgi:preprotein translocase subunit SecA
VFNTPVQLPVSHIMRPEKKIPEHGVIERFLQNSYRTLISPLVRLRFDPAGFTRHVLQIQKDYTLQNDQKLKERATELRQFLAGNEYDLMRLAEAFALVREASRRTLGMEHFPSQLAGGLAMFYGNIAEMQTGEGKSLTALLPACAAALQGIPVDIITVNDYLAARDADEMKPVFDFLGLSVGCVIHGLTPTERRQQYSRNVVYCTNKELVFDYLKDKILLKDRNHHLQLHAERLCGNNRFSEQCLLRGLHYAIIDEADSVLMDEARTPLIISGEMEGNQDQEQMYRQAMDIARELKVNSDFRLLLSERSLLLTSVGKDRIQAYTSELAGYWRSKVRSHEIVSQALTALHLFERDKHYLVIDGKVEIVDEHTGRVMENRSWERGLHQLIEIKEGCELTRPRQTLAKISYQGFFRKYHHLCGMTGTASEVASEFRSVYGLNVLKISPNRPCIRQHRGTHVVTDETQKWLWVRDRVKTLHLAGTPVLVGTRSVAASEVLSALLREAGLEHNLLNAKQDHDEADIIARAGMRGQITIATNMAGRGTDIKLEESVRRSDGLYVILTGLHDAGRIDRQLEGRCGRQGDPGQFEIIVSLDDPLLGDYAGRLMTYFSQSVNPGFLLGRFAYTIMKLNQKLTEFKHRNIRGKLLKIDQKQNELLSFSGRQI